jgi:uncharacterized protein YciI
MHYVMFYDYSDDYLERRSQYRAEHLRLAWESNARDELQLGGAYSEPADGALLIFKCNSPEIPERFATADPYVRNGLVRQRRIRAWTTVVGREAATPIK